MVVRVYGLTEESWNTIGGGGRSWPDSMPTGWNSGVGTLTGRLPGCRIWQIPLWTIAESCVDLSNILDGEV